MTRFLQPILLLVFMALIQPYTSQYLESIPLVNPTSLSTDLQAIMGQAFPSNLMDLLLAASDSTLLQKRDNLDSNEALTSCPLDPPFLGASCQQIAPGAFAWFVSVPTTITNRTVTLQLPTIFLSDFTIGDGATAVIAGTIVIRGNFVTTDQARLNFLDPVTFFSLLNQNASAPVTPLISASGNVNISQNTKITFIESLLDYQLLSGAKSIRKVTLLSGPTNTSSTPSNHLLPSGEQEFQYSTIPSEATVLQVKLCYTITFSVFSENGSSYAKPHITTTTCSRWWIVIASTFGIVILAFAIGVVIHFRSQKKNESTLQMKSM